MYKALLRILLPVLLLASALAFALVLPSSLAGSARVSTGGASHLNARLDSTHRAANSAQGATPTPPAAPVSQSGSTDGIVIMSFAIVLIILLPLLFQRRLWTK